MGATAAIVLIIFTIIYFIIIFNMSILNIYKQKVNFGIFKAFGMKSSEVRRSVILEMEILTILGVIVGVPLGLLTPSALLSLLTASIGITKINIDVNWIMVALSIPVCLLP